MTAETITPNDDVMALSDRELLERVAHQLDHLDQMAHEQQQLTAQLEPLLPLIPRALALLDPMRKMRRGKADAVPQRTPAPVHVGEASEDRGPVGA